LKEVKGISFRRVKRQLNDPLKRALSLDNGWQRTGTILVENLQQVNYNHNCQRRARQGSDGMIEHKPGGALSPEGKHLGTLEEAELV